LDQSLDLNTARLVHLVALHYADKLSFWHFRKLLALCRCGGFLFALRSDRVDSGHEAAIASQFARGIKPLGLLLDAQAEEVFFRLLECQLKLLVAHVAEF